MFPVEAPVSIASSLSTVALFLAVGACSSGGADDPLNPSTDDPATVSSELGTATGSGGCDSIAAGDGWLNTFIPQSTGAFGVTFRVYPSLGGNPFPPTIDGVIGLSNGPSQGFGSLGPIVRFAPSGNIDARNGSNYGGAFPYHFSDGPYEFQMSVDIPSHLYSVLVRHLDSPSKPYEVLATNFAFRTEQSGVTRLDNLGRFVDGDHGAIQLCGFTYSAPTACTSSSVGSWANQAFPSKTGTFRLEFDATPASGAIDAVIGASHGVPSSFAGLATIVRFRPDGTLDARKGATYAADATVGYSAGASYHIAMDINRTLKTYSVSVNGAGQAPTVLARDYAFRSEQAQVPSLDHLGQYVDGTNGSIQVCSLAVVY